MRKFFQNWDWEDTGFTILSIAVLLFISTIWTLVTADHKVRFYYLSGTYSETVFRIKGDIDWAEDNTILLDRTVTFDEALQMVEKLKTLK